MEPQREEVQITNREIEIQRKDDEELKKNKEEQGETVIVTKEGISVTTVTPSPGGEPCSVAKPQVTVEDKNTQIEEPTNLALIYLIDREHQGMMVVPADITVGHLRGNINRLIQLGRIAIVDGSTNDDTQINQIKHFVRIDDRNYEKNMAAAATKYEEAHKVKNAPKRKKSTDIDEQQLPVHGEMRHASRSEQRNSKMYTKHWLMRFIWLVIVSVDTGPRCHESVICSMNIRQADTLCSHDNYVCDRQQSTQPIHPRYVGSNIAEEALTNSKMKIKSYQDAFCLAPWETRHPGTEEKSKFICMLKSILGSAYAELITCAKIEYAEQRYRWAASASHQGGEDQQEDNFEALSWAVDNIGNYLAQGPCKGSLF